jgi:hypothetical protein
LKKLIHLLNNITFILILSFLFALVAILVVIEYKNFVKSDKITNIISDQYVDNNSQKVSPRIFNLIEYKDQNFSYEIDRTDFRAIVFDYYFDLNNSPLKGFGRIFVEKCEKYNAPQDCTILIAIAKVETDLCKYLPSQEQKNCWGFGGAGSNRYIFSTYTDAIDLINSRLVNGYGKYNMTHPNNMEVIYCGNDTTCLTWGERVQEAMDELNNLSVSMGYMPLYSLRTN